MQDGHFEFYTMQCRTVSKSPWLKPNDPLVPEKKDKVWFNPSWDVFGGSFEPWHGKGNDYRPKYRRSYEQTHDIWAKIGYHGWYDMKYALRALAQARKDDDAGKFDSRDGYGHHNQAVRHEFRVVKITLSKKTETELLVA